MPTAVSVKLVSWHLYVVTAVGIPHCILSTSPLAHLGLDRAPITPDSMFSIVVFMLPGIFDSLNDMCIQLGQDIAENNEIQSIIKSNCSTFSFIFGIHCFDTKRHEVKVEHFETN